jgi:glycosyltransferase involved in cell wall biosynthesis
MKILIYAHHFPPFRGGMEFSNFEIAKGLYKLGHSIQVMACRSQESTQFVSSLGFPVFLLPKWPFLQTYSLAHRARANWIFYPLYLSTFYKRIHEFKPDVIFVADETANCVWGTWANRVKVPYISYSSVPFLTVYGQIGRHGILSKLKHITNEFITTQFKRFVLRSYFYSKLLLVVSRSTKHELLKAAPQLDGKINIIPRSVDDVYFEQPVDKEETERLANILGIYNNDVVLLSVSSLIIDKGVDDVLKAISGLPDSILGRTKYIVVGEGEAQTYLQKMSKALNLEKTVIFTGAIHHKRLVIYYDLCDFFILPSRRGKEESFGRVFVEAAARSKPSIGVNEGGMVDVIDEGETGFLVRPGDIRMIRDRITCYISNPEQINMHGQKAKDKAKQKYHPNVIALQFQNHLKAACEMS